MTYNYHNLIHIESGSSSSFFWEQGFDKVCESSRTLELFKGFDVRIWEPGPSKCVKVCEPELLAEPQTEQPCIGYTT